jgi:hypothetical protein
MGVMAALQAMSNRFAAAGGGPWPGFDPGAVPVAIYDGTETLLFGHPAPPAGFLPAGAGVSIFPGLHPDVRACSTALIGDVVTATVMTPGIPIPEGASPAVTVASIVAHEAFHVYQWQHHPGWGCDESQALIYPVTSAPLHHLLLLEMTALERALAAADAAPWVRLALDLRRQRHALLSPGAVAYERGTERLEGLAHYVEMRYAASATPNLPRRPLRFGPEAVRARSYALGQALATLLDRFAPAWKEQITRNDTLFLDQMLEAALPADLPPATIEPETAAAALAQAGREAAEVETRRQALGNAFAAREGWRLQLIASPADPLRPRGFDPMNLHVLSRSEVLHTRYLKLGTGGGAAIMEVLGEALTEAAGDHPLFAGVARVTVAGLAEAPSIQHEGGTLTITGGGIQATCQNAAVSQGGQTIIITLR